MSIKLNYSLTLRVSPTGFGKGCQCAKGIQDTESSISNDTLKPGANKERKENFIQFSEVPTYVLLMNDLANHVWVCFSKSYAQISLAHPDFKVLDLNIHVKHIMHFFP